MYKGGNGNSKHPVVNDRYLLLLMVAHVLI